MVKGSSVTWSKIDHSVEDRSCGQGYDHYALNSSRFGDILSVKLALGVSYTKMVLIVRLNQGRLVYQGLVSKSWHTLD
jgi:hypothetical protein